MPETLQPATPTDATLTLIAQLLEDTAQDDIEGSREVSPNEDVSNLIETTIESGAPVRECAGASSLR